jgi:Asp-tRNA(Asn)/Glu-tRNA(Gln) amidotransferase C subunit
MQPASPTMMTPASGLSDTLAQITSALFLDAAQAAAVKVDPSAILTIDEDIAEYRRELKLIIDLQKQVQVIHTDNTDYARHIVSLKDDRKTANKTIQILQGLTTNAPTLRAIVLPHPPKYSGDRKELPNLISKVRSKLSGENRYLSDDQHKLRYVYGYLQDNARNQIQPYGQTNKISLEDVEPLIKILEAAFGDPDEVRMASGELDHLTQGNHEFSIYYAEFPRLMAILDYDSKAKKAALQQGLSKELQASLVYQTDEPEDFDKFVELCMKLYYRI